MKGADSGRSAPRVSDPVFDVSGRVVAVTGACGLIGRTLVHAFADRGARLFLLDKAAESLTALAGELEGRTPIATWRCDVTDAAAVAAACQEALDRFGCVDVLINSHHYKPQGFTTATAEDFPETLWDSIVDVQLKATFLTCREFGRAMLRRGKGSIINMASTYGVVSSNPDLYEENDLGNPVAYSASKGGVLMLSKYLGAHWAERGVRVNCVTPHGVWNHQAEAFIERLARKSPLRRMMKAEELIGAVLFLASDASSYATASNLFVDGGWTAW